jgi:hypothetical protein
VNRLFRFGDMGSEGERSLALATVGDPIETADWASHAATKDCKKSGLLCAYSYKTSRIDSSAVGLKIVTRIHKDADVRNKRE